jgi:hypothetical protein
MSYPEVFFYSELVSTYFNVLYFLKVSKLNQNIMTSHFPHFSSPCSVCNYLGFEIIIQQLLRPSRKTKNIHIIILVSQHEIVQYTCSSI